MHSNSQVMCEWDGTGGFDSPENVAERKRNQRARAKAKGLCEGCCAEPRKKGIQRCARCAGLSNERVRAKRERDKALAEKARRSAAKATKKRALKRRATSMRKKSRK